MTDDINKNNVRSKILSSSVIATAQSLHRLGFITMPVGSDKRPKLQSWKWLQQGDIEWTVIQPLFQKHPLSGIAILTGNNGFAVLDIDDTDLADIVLQYLYEKAPIIRTPSGGIHVYLREFKISRSAPLIVGVADIKSRGGYILCPPSHGYRKENDVKKLMRVGNARDWAAKYLAQFGHDAKESSPIIDTDDNTTTSTIKEGARNSTLAGLAGTLRHRGLSAEAIAAALHGINQISCIPPLSNDEIVAIAKSYGRYDAGKNLNNLTSNTSNHMLEVKSVPTFNAGELLQHAQAGGTEMPFHPLLGLKGYIPKGWCTLLAGSPKVGKTELLVALIKEWVYG